MALTELEIIEKLRPIENKLRNKNTMFREDIQNALNILWGNGLTVNKKADYIQDMIQRSGIKIERSFYSPRVKNYEYGDRTNAFRDDLLSYRGVKERQ